LPPFKLPSLPSSIAAEFFSSVRYESQTTKSPELNFSALVDGNGARNVRFERAFRT
jgi:hypothetical protein